MLAALALAAAVSTPDAAADFAAWRRVQAQTCPAGHVARWLPARNTDDLIDQFLAAQPHPTEARVRKAAEYWRCADAAFDGANWCELYADLHGLRKTGLLGEFARFACDRWQCTAFADCERPPAPGGQPRAGH
jgi:hypothetical protein